MANPHPKLLKRPASSNTVFAKGVGLSYRQVLALGGVERLILMDIDALRLLIRWAKYDVDNRAGRFGKEQAKRRRKEDAIPKSQ